MLVRRLAPLLTVLLFVAAVGCGGGGKTEGPGQQGHGRVPGGQRGENGAKKEEPAIAVSAGEVTQEPISSLYSTSATLRADRQATVIARTRGVVRRLAVEEGNAVSAGQPLAYLEDEEQTIAAARARSAEETARRDYERLSGLYDRGLVSVDEYEAKRRDAEDALHALELAELELSRTVIRAPIAGMVVIRHLDVGATVSDGTPVYDLADLQPLYADVNIPERHVTRLQPSQDVLLTADATGTVARAVIERISPAVDPATGTVKVTVAVEGDSGLRPGAFIRVDIVTDTPHRCAGCGTLCARRGGSTVASLPPVRGRRHSRTDRGQARFRELRPRRNRHHHTPRKSPSNQATGSLSWERPPSPMVRRCG